MGNNKFNDCDSFDTVRVNGEIVEPGHPKKVEFMECFKLKYLGMERALMVSEIATMKSSEHQSFHHNMAMRIPIDIVEFKKSNRVLILRFEYANISESSPFNVFSHLHIEVLDYMGNKLEFIPKSIFTDIKRVNKGETATVTLAYYFDSDFDAIEIQFKGSLTDELPAVVMEAQWDGDSSKYKRVI